MPPLDFSYWKRAQDAIAQGSLTNSKHPSSFVFGVYPTHVVGGSGAFLFDPWGRRYIDYILGLGTNLFGYSPPELSEHLIRKLHAGFSHSLPTTQEIDTAEKLKAMFYFVDKFKFLKTGNEAALAAIRMARAYTGRKLVLSEGYHGHGDEFISLMPNAKGVHSCLDIATYGADIDLKDVAAVIIEPVITDFSDERKAFLLDLSLRCKKAGCVLIFDEIITGFRFERHCVALWANILPDLIILGKAMANGLPLAAVGGKKEIMDADYFVSSTYAGETLSLSACEWIVNKLLNDPKYKIDKLWDSGDKFYKRFNELASPYIELFGYPTRGIFKAEERVRALFFQEAAKASFLFGPSFFYGFSSQAHDFIFFTFLKGFIDRLKLGKLTLEGEMPRSPFSERIRDGKTN